MRRRSLCLAPAALADHTLSHLVSPPGNAAYDWVGGMLSPEDVLSTAYMSPDGSRVILATAQPFDPADTDAQVDLYESVGGTFQLLTSGSAGGNGPFFLRHVDFSLDGSHVLFETNEALVPEDRDFLQDVYEHSGGVTRLVSVGDFAGSGVFDAYLRDVSEDGTKAFFSTAETLIAADADGGYMDVFERSGGDTELDLDRPADRR